AERELRIAAVGDLHYDAENRGMLRDLFTAANRDADILVLCGDLTTTGRPEQMEGFAEELSVVQIPVVTVFGNHDHDAEAIAEATVILRQRSVHVLDGEHVTLQGVGFVG